MHPRLLSLILFLLHLNLLCSHTQSHPQLPPPSNFVISFIPSTPASLRSIRKLLTYCCRNANLISHTRFTLNQVNVLTLPPTQYRILQSLRSPLPALPKLRVLHSPLSEHTWPHLTRQAAPTPDFYAKYQTFDDLQTKWNDLAHRYAVRTSEIGLSIERRPIVLLRIGSTDPDNPTRILINALQHAREWITAAAVTFIAEKLAINSIPDGEGDDPKLQEALRSIEVLIVPIVNPDGYVYSHIKDEDNSARFWRKNRRPYSGECTEQSDDFREEEFAPGGVDLNRNWGKDFGGKWLTSRDQCNIAYIGAHAFSEPETQAMSELIKSTDGIVAHIDFHSYGQVILGPWASSEETPSRACEYDIVGRQMEIAMLAGSGFHYTYGRGQKFKNEQFAASGVMTDWVHQEFPQTLSYTVELRPQNVFGNEGFELPADQILPTSNEAFAAVRTLLRYGNDTEAFLNASQFSQCRTTTASQGISQQGSSTNVGLIAGIAVAVVLVIAISTTCFVVFRIRRRRSTEKQLEEMNTPHDDTTKEGGSLESVCAVVKVPQTLLQPGTIEAPSSNETLNTGHIQYEVLSAVSNECITPLLVDESPSTWYNTEGGSSYGNTVLLDGQNPFFPGHSTSAGPPKHGS